MNPRKLIICIYIHKKGSGNVCWVDSYIQYLYTDLKVIFSDFGVVQKEIYIWSKP